ncbi:putative protein OCTOPUS [Helianthus anomalus]
MAFYMDESQLYKCSKHPSRRRVSGICAKCLRERLVTLCPDCATARPCHCSPAPADSSSSSSTSSASFSLFSFSRGGSRRDSGSVTGGSDPTLRKSRSVAVSFLRSRSRHAGTGTGTGIGDCLTDNNNVMLPKVSRSKINFWSVFTVNKSKKCELHVDDTGVDEELNKCVDNNNNNNSNNNSVMMRSRSVAVGGGNGFTPASVKQKGWFRYSKPPRSVAVS